MSQVSTKEPLFHIVKREGVTFVRASLIRLVAILLALVVCAFVIMGMTGMNPLSVYAGIWSGAVGTARRTWVTLRDSAILLCIGFAVLPAFRLGGAEAGMLVLALTLMMLSRHIRGLTRVARGQEPRKFRRTEAK